MKTCSRAWCTRAALLAAFAAAAAPAPAEAGIVVYEDGAKFVEIGGQIQLQYYLFEPDAGEAEDDVFFRRLRVDVEGGVTEGWEGKIQVDYGKSDVALKEVYLRYGGFERFEDLEVTVGNQNPPFSRSTNTSSKELQLVERPFVGDNNYGASEYMTGVRVDDSAAGGRIDWAASFGSASIDPDAAKLDFDTPVNADADFNQGWIAAGRVDWHPFGAMGYTTGHFVDLDPEDPAPYDEYGLTLGVAAFTWSNDGDNDTYTDAAGRATSATKADVDAAEGFEVAAGFRGFRLSADAQYQVIDAETVDPRFTGGLFRAGDAELDVFAVHGGFMALPNTLELVAGYQSLDTEAYRDAWTRTSLGANWFLDRHRLKAQLTWRMGESLDGVPGNDADELFLQLQYAF